MRSRKKICMVNNLSGFLHLSPPTQTTIIASKLVLTSFMLSFAQCYRMSILRHLNRRNIFRNFNDLKQFYQNIVTSTVLSITKQGCFEFVCGRFFSVICVDNVYLIRKIFLYIHATYRTPKQQGADRRHLLLDHWV